jgi:hypothetical protein
LPIAFFGNLNLDISGVSRCNGFKSIVSSAEDVLGNMCSCHRLTCGTRGKTSRVIFLCFAGGGMSCKRSSTYISHLKHLCTNPSSACFDSFARSVVFRVCLLKIRKHSFGTIRSTTCQRPLILFVVFLVSSHSMVALPLHRRFCGISICFPWLIDFGVPIFLLVAALPIVAGLVCVI